MKSIEELMANNNIDIKSLSADAGRTAVAADVICIGLENDDIHSWDDSRSRSDAGSDVTVHSGRKS